MKKKILIIALILAVAAGNLYAEDEDESEAAAVSLSSNRITISILELTYERVFTPHLSLLASVSYSDLAFYDSLAVTGKLRWYPFGGIFFLDAGVGFSYGYSWINDDEDVGNVIADAILILITISLAAQFIDWDKYEKTEGGGLCLQAGMGWNIDIGKRDGFRLPIYFGMDARIRDGSSPVLFFPYLRIGLSYAF